MISINKKDTKPKILFEQYRDYYVFRNSYTWGLSKSKSKVSLLPNIEIDQKKIPFVIILKITKKCNLNCSYCYSSKKADSIDYNTINELCNKILSYDKPVQLIFHGGEPILEMDKIKYIVHKLKKKQNLIFNIQTNGVLLDKNNISFFKKNKINVCISFDGPKRYHNLYRSDFDKTYGTVKLCNTLKFNPSIICVLNEQSIKKPKELFNFFRKLKIKRMKFNLISSKTPRYSCEEIVTFYKTLYELIVANNLNNKGKFYDVMLSNLIKRLLFNINVDHCNFACNAGKQLIAIAPNGEIYPCDYFLELKKFKLTKIKKFDFDLIPKNNNFNLIYNNNLKFCSKCAFKGFIFCNCISNVYFNKKEYCDFWRELIYFIMLKVYSNPSEVALLIGD